MTKDFCHNCKRQASFRKTRRVSTVRQTEVAYCPCYRNRKSSCHPGMRNFFTSGESVHFHFKEDDLWSLLLLGKHRRGQLLTSWSYLKASVPREEDFNDYIFQQDGAPPDFHTAARNHLNARLLVTSCGADGRQDRQTKLDMISSCEAVFVVPQSRSLTEFKKRITTVTASLSRETAKSLRQVGLPSTHLPCDSWSTHRVSVRCEKSFASSSVHWCQLELLSMPHVFCITLKEWLFSWPSYIHLFFEYI